MRLVFKVLSSRLSGLLPGQCVGSLSAQQGALLMRSGDVEPANEATAEAVAALLGDAPESPTHAQVSAAVAGTEVPGPVSTHGAVQPEELLNRLPSRPSSLPLKPVATADPDAGEEDPADPTEIAGTGDWSPTEIDGVGPAIAKKVTAGGFSTQESLRGATKKQLAEAGLRGQAIRAIQRWQQS